jgi:hypothetical protein
MQKQKQKKIKNNPIARKRTTQNNLDKFWIMQEQQKSMFSSRGREAAEAAAASPETPAP